MSLSIRRRQLMLGSGLALLFPLAQAAAQETPTQLSPVIVTAPLSPAQADLVEGSTVLEGAELDRRRAATLGETLQNTPGVSATQFGAGASRPIIRGQGGPRVRIMENGIDTFDAATVSPDHAVVAPVGSAKRIEVLRGPATLLYGSSAIGGVVNVIDGRIPDAVPKDGVGGTARVDYGTGAQDKSGFAAVDAAVTDRFVVHGEGGALNADDYAAARAPGGGQRVRNSALRSENGAAGASYLGEAGYAGLSVAKFSSYYGVPGGERVHIDLEQRRLDGKFGLYEPLGFLDELNVKAGIADYQHDEIESTGVRATRFQNDSWEARAEALHKPIFAGIEGVVGVQSSRRDFKATGAEANIPPTQTDSTALFVLEQLDTGFWLFALGGRAERVEVDNLRSKASRDFTAASLSASATYRFTPMYQTGVSFSRTERAPTAEELYSNGKHLATRAFEIGNAGLDKETAWYSEVSLRKVQGDVTGGINLFVTRFNDYIYGAFTGQQQEDLNELRYSQTGAEFRGAELEAAWTFWRDDTGRKLGLDGGLDYVRAEDRSNHRALPLIPPLGYRLGFVAENNDLAFRLEMVGVADQDRNGINETGTAGYRLFNTALTWRPFAERRGIAISLQGRNLLDQDGLVHTSMLKNDAPIRGRELRLGSSVTF
jgi:iron complex outermembrane receptor protein